MSTCLPWGELRVRSRVDQVRGRGMVGEPDHRAVDIDSDGSVGGTSGAGEQVGPGCGQDEDHVLVDLALVEALVDRLLSPLAELRVPQRAVGLRVTRVLLSREVAEDVQKVATIAQSIDEGRVGRRGVFGCVSVEDQMLDALSLAVVGTGL